MIRRRVLIAVSTLALVLAACGGGGDDPTAATTVVATTPAPATVPVTTPAPTAPAVPTSTVAATTAAPETTAPSTTQPISTEQSGTLSGDHVELQSDVVLAPFLLDRVGEYGTIRVYDGVSSGDDGLVLRCLAIARDGASGWYETCTLAGEAGSFVFLDGIDPWIVDFGTEVGDVVLAQQPFDWAITSSGCVEPIVNVIAAAAIEPAVATGIACVGNEAFMTFGSVLMQDGPPDGGGMLLTYGDEGWNSSGGGTSFGCTDFSDGIDRCDSFGVDYEMFEAVSPLPSPEVLPPVVDAVNVRETTDEIAAMVGDAADLDAITGAVLAGLSQPDAEVEPTTVRHDDLGFGGVSMLVVDVPLMDDSTRSTTNVVWLNAPRDDRPGSVRKAYAWDNCARGVSSGLCV